MFGYNCDTLYCIPTCPVYRPDMPNRLRMSELVGGLLKGVLKNVRHWLHLGFVVMVWLAMVPICICELALLNAVFSDSHTYSCIYTLYMYVHCIANYYSVFIFQSIHAYCVCTDCVVNLSQQHNKIKIKNRHYNYN